MTRHLCFFVYLPVKTEASHIFIGVPCWDKYHIGHVEKLHFCLVLEPSVQVVKGKRKQLSQWQVVSLIRLLWFENRVPVITWISSRKCLQKIRTQIFIMHVLKSYLFKDCTAQAIPSFRLSVLWELNFGKPGMVLHTCTPPSTWKAEARWLCRSEASLRTQHSMSVSLV